MSKSIKKIASFALPIAASFIPGIGPVASAAIGAGSGLLGGGGLKGALLGAATGGIGKVLTGGGSIPGLGSIGGKLGAAGMGPPTPATGLLGALKNAGSGLIGGGSGGGLSLGNIGTAISGINSYNKQDDLEKTLLKAQGKAEKVISPYNQTGQLANQTLSNELQSGELGGEFNPGDLTQDPGYQFRLQEGEKALQRRLAAAGMSDSGAALKATTEFGQGLADQTYNDAYNRYLEQQRQRYSMLSGQSGQGLQAAGGMADIYGNQGNISANADVARNNIMTGTLSSILGGAGKRQIVGYKADGSPIYAEEAA